MQYYKYQKNDIHGEIDFNLNKQTNVMTTDQTFKKLKEALMEKFGSEVNDSLSSEKLSIDIFLNTGNYVSRSTIMHLYGIVEKKSRINKRILDILGEYADLSNFKFHIDDACSSENID